MRRLLLVPVALLVVLIGVASRTPARGLLHQVVPSYATLHDNPATRLGERLAEKLRRSKLGRSLSNGHRGPVVYRVR
jgi:hypothetical protein